MGEVGILARHAPMIARLVPAELRLHLDGGETRRYAQGEGWLEVFANRARVLVAEAVSPDALGRRRAARAARGRRAGARRGREGTAAQEAAERETRRLEAFLQIAENT